MISSKHRFHGHGSLRYVYQHGEMVRGSILSIKYAPNSRRSAYRAAVVISRKVSKSAVVRNRIRRRLYEVVRRHEPAMKAPYDIVITVFSEQLASLPPEKLENLVAALLRRAGIV